MTSRRPGAALALGAALAAAILAGPAAAQPKLGIDGGRKFDFGELFALVPVTRELTLRNEGTDTLRISSVSASCGCTATLLSRHDIPPGGAAGLKVTFDPAKFKGGVEKIISFKTNDPANPRPEIVFTAKVSGILDLDRTHLTMATLVDSAIAAVVTVRNVSDAPVRITAARSNSPEVTLSLSGDALDPGAAAELTCTVLQSKAGLLRAEITLSTDHPRVPSIVLPVVSFARSAPAAKPNAAR